jgi:prepilin-type N-terminal cleavage/methylation domain-containing protein
MNTTQPVRSDVRFCRKSSAFTLIELLVVVAVIALLAAMLLPVLARAKATAKRVPCMNNQKQLALIWIMYASDNDDRLASNGLVDPPDTQRKLWIQGAFINPGANSTDRYMLDPQYALFADYLKTTKVYVCPTDRQTNALGGSYPKLRSYSLNAYMGWIGPWDTRLSSAYRIFRKYSETTKLPAGFFLFQDVNPNSICWPYFGVQMDTDVFFNFPGSSHSRGNVISYSDGHVQYHRWEDSRTVLAFSYDYHAHYEPSSRNPDIVWLRERTTVRP